MPKLGEKLESAHVLLLLRKYLGRYDQSIEGKEKVDPLFGNEEAFGRHDYEYIVGPNDHVCGFDLDVKCDESDEGVQKKLLSAYWRTIVRCLQEGTRPKSIRIISIINHRDKHWTCAVSNITIKQDFWHRLEQAQLGVSKINTDDMVASMTLKGGGALNRKILDGAENISIEHYDSHSNTQWFDSFNSVASKIAKPDDCNISITAVQNVPLQESGSEACGDHAVRSGFVAGFLGESVQYDPIKSSELRSFTNVALMGIVDTTTGEEQSVTVSEEDISNSQKVEENLEAKIELVQREATVGDINEEQEQVDIQEAPSDASVTVEGSSKLSVRTVPKSAGVHFQSDRPDENFQQYYMARFKKKFKDKELNYKVQKDSTNDKAFFVYKNKQAVQQHSQDFCRIEKKAGEVIFSCETRGSLDFLIASAQAYHGSKRTHQLKMESDNYEDAVKVVAELGGVDKFKEVKIGDAVLPETELAKFKEDVEAHIAQKTQQQSESRSIAPKRRR